MPVVIPRRAQVLHFQPYETRARIALGYYVDTGTEEDVEYIIRDGTDNRLVARNWTGSAARHINVAPLTLVAGRIYTCRARWKNEVGAGPWSVLFATAVPGAENLPAVVVPGEPRSDSPLTVPIDPDFVAAPAIARDMTEWITSTGHVMRRLRATDARQASAMAWSGLTTTDKDTLVSFLEARIDAVESFATDDPAHGTRQWFARQGRLQVDQTNEGVWAVAIDADEVRGRKYWTVGESTVEGPDPIR